MPQYTCKCHYTRVGQATEDANFCFDGNTYVISKEEKIVDIIIDNALLFDSHIKEVCKKASQRLVALSRLATYLELEVRKLIFDSMIKSEFAYCPLISMFCSRNRIT